MKKSMSTLSFPANLNSKRWLAWVFAPAALLVGCGAEPQSSSASASQPQLIHAENHHTQPNFEEALHSVTEVAARLGEALKREDANSIEDTFGQLHGQLHTLPLENLSPHDAQIWKSADNRIMEILHPMAVSTDLAIRLAYYQDFEKELTSQKSHFFEKKGIHSFSDKPEVK
jgi:hypothetical protein